jgi:hypothetical protein
VKFTAAPTSGNIGQQLQYTAVVKNAAGKVCGSAVIDWSSDNTAIVTINSNGLATLKFDNDKTHYPATIHITATAHNTAISTSPPATLTVANPVDHVVVTPLSPSTLVVCGSPNTQQFLADPQTASNVTVPGVTIFWHSSNQSVATISNTGLATAVDSTNSPTNITATAYSDTSNIVSNAVSLGVSGGATITVSVTPASGTVPAGSTDAITATVGGVCTTCDVTWSVDDPAPPANGTVSPAGPNTATTYTAPAAVPTPATITVRATSTENANCMGTAVITVNPTFGSPKETSLGGGQKPQALVIGQFNATSDGSTLGPLDVAVADQDTNDVSILLGNGTGNLTLNGAASTTANSYPVSIAKGHFDSDTLSDLATANFGTNDAAILMGNGDGTFTAASPATIGVGTSPQSVAAGDFDNPPDGLDDLAVANYFSSDITILKSTGGGSFTITQTISIPTPSRGCILGPGPFAVATGFIDGDGSRDLAVADLACDTVWIYLGNGDGTFSLISNSPVEVLLPIGTGPAAIVIADFDGDTSVDLAVVNQGTADTSCPPSGNQDAITVLFGLGDGNFPTQATYPVGSNPRAIAVGDFNHDMVKDLVTANYCSNDVSVLFGVGDGTFQPAVNYYVDPSGSPGSQLPTGIAVGDLDNNGFDDIAVSNAGTDSVSVLLNNN